MSQKININNKILIIPNNKNISKLNYTSFILPLRDFSIGFEVYFEIDEINKLSGIYDIFVIINKFMHKDDINKLESIIKKLKNIKGYFVEDVGLTDIIEKDKIILYQNHITNNYNAINFLRTKGLNNIVVSNELTYNELINIRKNTKSILYYFLINKNIIMYSKRSLISNYYKNYNILSKNNLLVLNESLKKNKLILKEEQNQSIIYNYSTFCGNKYLEVIKDYDYLIINLTLISESESNIILNNIDNINLYNMIECNYYFLENEIKYKVKDL